MRNEAKKLCIKSVAFEARALPLYDPKNVNGNLTEKAEYIYTITEPYTNGFYYLLVVTDAQVRFDIHVVTSGIYFLLYCTNFIDLLDFNLKIP